MKIFKFYGSSDDNFIAKCADDEFADEIGCYDSFGVWKLESSEGALFVTGFYSPEGTNGCWAVGVCPIDEDVPIPNWPTLFQLSERGYSTELWFVVPDDTKATPAKGDQ